MELAGLRAEVDRLKAIELPADPAALGAGIVEFDRVVHEVLAQKSRWLAAFDRAEGYVDAGQTSSKAWLTTQTLASAGRAAAEQSVCRLRDRLPRLFGAWEAGQTTFEHVSTTEVVLRKLPEQLWPEVDGEITAKARVLTVK